MKTLKIAIAILALAAFGALAFLRPKLESERTATTRPPLPMMIVVGVVTPSGFRTVSCPSLRTAVL